MWVEWFPAVLWRGRHVIPSLHAWLTSQPLFASPPFHEFSASWQQSVSWELSSQLLVSPGSLHEKCCKQTHQVGTFLPCFERPAFADVLLFTILDYCCWIWSVNQGSRYATPKIPFPVTKKRPLQTAVINIPFSDWHPITFPPRLLPPPQITGKQIVLGRDCPAYVLLRLSFLITVMAFQAIELFSLSWLLKPESESDIITLGPRGIPWV